MIRGRAPLPVLALACSLAMVAVSAPATADMFGDGFKPCGDAASTAATVDCTTRKTKEWDRRLNASYGELLRSAEADQRPALQAAQRLWLQYRDANCAFYAAGPGTIRQVNAAECLRAMTQDRASEFEQALRP